MDRMYPVLGKELFEYAYGIIDHSFSISYVLLWNNVLEKLHNFLFTVHFTMHIKQKP